MIDAPEYTLVVLSKKPEVFAALMRSIQMYETRHPKIILVTNGNPDEFTKFPVTKVIHQVDPFVFAKSANLGIQAAGTDDVILCNDDVRLVRDQTLYRLRSWSYSESKVGILSPVIDGWVGNLYQNAYEVKGRWPRKDDQSKASIISMRGRAQVCFICVYIKRQCINAIGPMDENYSGYGFEDNDYCMSARKAGWETAITRHVVVKHGEGGAHNNRGVNWSTTFAKEEITQEAVRHNYNYFISKWGIREDEFPLVAA